MSEEENRNKYAAGFKGSGNMYTKPIVPEPFTFVDSPSEAKKDSGQDYKTPAVKTVDTWKR